MGRKVLGLLCVLPLIGLAGFFVAVAGFLIRAWGNESVGQAMLSGGLMAALLGLAAAVPALIACLVWLFRSDLPSDRKALWGVLLVMANAIALPLFWWLVVRKQPA